MAYFSENPPFLWKLQTFSFWYELVLAWFHICFVQVDVIVNTATSDLNLNIGAVSASLLKKAGQALQDECKTKFADGVKVGDLADTKGHSLACKAVYHLTMPAWSNANSKEVGWMNGVSIYKTFVAACTCVDIYMLVKVIWIRWKVIVTSLAGIGSFCETQIQGFFFWRWVSI